MTKRLAKNQMTQDNWMNEDEPEEAGIFSVAAESKLQGRIIRKAKRRNISEKEGKNGVPSTPFASFAGFVSTKSSSFANIKSNPNMNGDSPMLFSKNDVLPKPTSPARTSAASFVELSSSVKLTTSLPGNTFKASNGCSENKTEYLEKLKSLNESFFNWVQEHMSKNAYSDFSPVCSDYIDHARKLENTISASSFKFSPGTNVSSQTFSFGISAGSKTPPKISSNCNSESFPVTQSTSPSIGFKSLSQKNTTDSPKLFSFSSQVASSNTDSSTPLKEDDENYVPPKNEFEAVKESDALYSKRCKLFFKKGENYAEKGIGTLFLKDLSGKTQLLVRADTSLGNILLNIKLTDSLPISRTGKNNVLIVCIPNPPLNPKETPEPTPLLFRVKTTQDADELLETLNKYKSSSKSDP